MAVSQHITTLLMLAALGAQSARADYTADFEPPTFIGSAAGTPLSGQDDFYVPPSGNVDGLCYTYADNSLGVVANPRGGTQFIACTRASNAFSRVQHDVDIDANCWAFELDFNLLFVGTLPANNYAGSVSLQPYPGAGAIVILFYWDDVNTCQTFSVRVLGYDAQAGIPYLAGLPVPAPGFRGLTANTWYRLAMRIEFRLNRLNAISVKDLNNDGLTFPYVPQNQQTVDFTGFYLGGGAVSSGFPTGFRFFSGGGFPGDLIPGNTLAVDNVRLVPTQTTDCFPDLDFNREINLQDLADLLAHFGTLFDASYFDGDLDCDADVDLNDLALMLANFGRTCF